MAAPEADLTRALYEQYANQIFRYCLHQLGNREEAEDAVQSTFLNAFRGIRRGVVPELESAWLFKIAHNVCLSRRRSSWRRGKVESPADFDVVEELTPAPARRAEELMGFKDVLADMPENQRRAILLREWQGLSYREIAEELELSQAAVETLIFRGRRALAQGLEQPPEPKRRRIARAADWGNVIAGVKSALLSGGAAVKVAATVAVVSGSTVVATAPVQHHIRSNSHTAQTPTSASAKASSKPSSGSLGFSAAGPAGGLRVVAPRHDTQGPAAGKREHKRTRAHATAAPPAATAAAATATADTVNPEPTPAAPAAPVEQPQAPQSEPQHSAPTPVAPTPASPAPTTSPTQAQPSTDKTDKADKTKTDPKTDTKTNSKSDDKSGDSKPDPGETTTTSTSAPEVIGTSTTIPADKLKTLIPITPVTVTSPPPASSGSGSAPTTPTPAPATSTGPATPTQGSDSGSSTKPAPTPVPSSSSGQTITTPSGSASGPVVSIGVKTNGKGNG